ncbi:LysR family transcriptional regulator ArgP [Pseudarthrobacter sp. J1738]|uniref:LysR family transcriptional regulator ArgP n=1 Tax=Pseudarthrobacter sp. J1738 TaxID=3420446 RepID=UPI003D2C6A69
MSRFAAEQLETFAAVLSEGTLDAAARTLHITPSAVSQRLKSLEHAAGRVLLQRSNPVRATEAGEVVLRLARQSAQLELDAATALGLPGEKSGQNLPLVVNADSLAVWFLKALARVPRELQVTFDIHRDDEQHSTDLLRSGTVMAAVTATPHAVQGCSVQGLGVMRYLPVASPNFVAHWLPDGVNAQSLTAAPAVDYDRKDKYQQQFLTTLGPERQTDTGESAQAPAQPAGPRHHVPATQDFADAIRLGLGWGLIPEQQCGPDLANGTLVELRPGHVFDVPLYWQRWRISSTVLDILSETVRQTAAEILRPI